MHTANLGLPGRVDDTRERFLAGDANSSTPGRDVALRTIGTHALLTTAAGNHEGDVGKGFGVTGLYFVGVERRTISSLQKELKTVVRRATRAEKTFVDSRACPHAGRDDLRDCFACGTRAAEADCE